MNQTLLTMLRCPVTRSTLQLQVISKSGDEILEGILRANKHWFYPIIGGIPRLFIEAYDEYKSFFLQHLPEYEQMSKSIELNYAGLIEYSRKKNRRTRKSFSFEWSFFDYEKDKTWDADQQAMLNRFLVEANEDSHSISGKLIFDAGCGNGLLDQLLAAKNAMVVAMDFSNSIERAFQKNAHPNVHFIQGDVQFPPVVFEKFDIVHCSGVLIHTNNTELSFSCIEPCVKEKGKLSVWLYHPRKDVIHNLFNFIRRFTSKLPITLQYYLYLVTLLPISYVIKRLKGNKQNVREMKIEILDWFTPEFRWEHSQDEAASWFYKRNYSTVSVTTTEKFGFNITGIKNPRN